MNKKIFKFISSQLLPMFMFVGIGIFFPTRVLAQCSPDQIDLLEYMGPDSASNFDLRYCSANGQGSEPIQVKRDIVQTTQGPRSGFFLNKGSNYEAYFYDDNNIYFYEDISWDEKCPDGTEAFYRVFTPNAGPGGRIPRCVNIGQQFSSDQYIIAYSEEGYNHGDTGNICNDGYSSTTVQTIVEDSQNSPYVPNIPGTNPEDTIILHNISGAGAGEYKFYTKGYGLSAFVAKDENDNIFYQSSFYKDGLSEAEPNLFCSPSSSGSNYTDAVYPEYGIDPTKSYISPIKNLVDGSGNTKYSVSKLRKELTSQGYQSYCASEGIEVKPSYNTQELINRYFSLVDQGQLADELRVIEIESTQTLSTVNAKYPLWRDVSNKQFLMASLEEYFGFKDIYEKSPSKSVLSSSAINSLLSEPQMCLQGWKNLVAQELACERLQNPGECELFTRPIPGTAYTVKTLLDDLKEYEPEYRAGQAKNGCIRLFQDYSNTGSLVNNDVNKAFVAKLKKGLINTPTYFDRAYRYGFIVAVIHTKNPGLSDSNTAMKIFNFFTQTTQKQEPRDEVLVAAFKLPDIGTNKFQNEDNAVQFWDDPLSLTRLLLSTNKKNDLHEANTNVEDPENLVTGRNEIAQELFEAAESQKGKQTPDDKIFCSTAQENEDGYLVNGTTTKSCQSYLTKALTDIINGSSDACGDAEAVSVIKDVAGLDNPNEPYGRVFNADNGLEVILNLFKGDITHPPAGTGNQTDPQIAATKDPAEKLQSIFNINNTNWKSRDDNPATIDFYVVYPMGFELEAVEEAMKGAFFTKAQLAVLEEQQGVDNFQMTGLATELTSSSGGWGYEDVEKTKNEECGSTRILDPDTGEPTGEVIKNTCNEEVSITLKTESSKIGVLGARLGFWMRQVQKQLSTRTSKAWSYFNSCATTEEFMLGKCSGGSKEFDNSDEDLPYCYGIDTSKEPNFTQINPSYEAQTPLSPSVSQIPETPYLGSAMYYGKGLMETVRTGSVRGSDPRLVNKDITNCEIPEPGGYQGCVALLRSGDIGRDVWMQRPGQEPEGPFLVIDVAARKDIPCLLARDWVVDIDYSTAERWGMTGVGPLPGVKICDNPSCN